LTVATQTKPKPVLDKELLDRARLAGLLLDSMAGDDAAMAASPAAGKKIKQAGQLLAEACELLGAKPSAKAKAGKTKAKAEAKAPGRKAK
jgi:hypothetical protein